MPTDTMTMERVERIEAGARDVLEYRIDPDARYEAKRTLDLCHALREAWEERDAARRDSRRLDHLDKVKMYSSASYGYHGDTYTIVLDAGLEHDGSGEQLSLFGAIDRDMEKLDA